MVLFFSLSLWQLKRHQQKIIIIKNLENRIQQPPKDWSYLTSDEKLDPNYRKVILEGEFQYDDEITVRNRRLGKISGSHVITPIKLISGEYILINRGFVPLTLSDKSNRIKINRPEKLKFVALLKASQPRKFLAPTDQTASINSPRVESWLRVDIDNIQNQLSYKVLPFYAEIIGDPNDPNLENKIIQNSSMKAEIFMPSEQIFNMVDSNEELNPLDYPIPAFDPVIPAGRHLGYVFEWGALALATILIGVILSLKPPKKFIAVTFILILISGCSANRIPSSMVTSYYGPGLHGKKTASGETFNSFAFTAAHKTLPFGTKLYLTNPSSQKSCIVTINDRGPFIDGRDLDISEEAAYHLGIIKTGVVELEVQEVS